MASDGFPYLGGDSHVLGRLIKVVIARCNGRLLQPYVLLEKTKIYAFPCSQGVFIPRMAPNARIQLACQKNVAPSPNPNREFRGPESTFSLTSSSACLDSPFEARMKAFPDPPNSPTRFALALAFTEMCTPATGMPAGRWIDPFNNVVHLYVRSLLSDEHTSLIPYYRPLAPPSHPSRFSGSYVPFPFTRISQYLISQLERA